MPYLTRLHVLHKRFTSLDQLARIISSIPSLQEIYLQDVQCDPRPAPPFPHNPRFLDHLSIQGCILSLEQISAFLKLSVPLPPRTALAKATPSAEAAETRISAVDALTAVNIATVLLASYYTPDVDHIGQYWQQICLSVQHTHEAKTNDFQWILSLQERSGNGPRSSSSREVLRLSIAFRSAERGLPGTIRQLTIDLYNCYKPRPVTHWPEFRLALGAVDNLILPLPHCTEFVLRIRDYSTWDEPWLPALEKHAREIDESVHRAMPHACAKGSVRVEHLGTVDVKNERVVGPWRP
ncbi:hypothetical protein PsYK624_112730 [Phanerochaete sordida]|uniref:F-box domain-containing protein n=1 Tax=Phanerochaete sordida TaxID=48140 RepID=A0A9P3GHN7_9APHY|nr:hypothetical protein PsYK624_112730 [Phanerochaete sordida]